jgi:hypothetical protein
VRRDQQIALAEALRAHRERLDEIVTELAERGEPISRLEARLIVDAGTTRLEHIEAALRGTNRARSSPGKVMPRLRSWTKPRRARSSPGKVMPRLRSWTKPRIVWGAQTRFRLQVHEFADWNGLY